MRAAVSKLDTSECAVFVQGVAHKRQIADVIVIPDRAENKWQDVVLWSDRDVFRVDRTPSTFGLDSPQLRLHSRRVRAGADAMWGLVEAVAHRLGAELDRLKENVVLRITGQLCSPSVS